MNSKKSDVKFGEFWIICASNVDHLFNSIANTFVTTANQKLNIRFSIHRLMDFSLFDQYKKIRASVTEIIEAV